MIGPDRVVPVVRSRRPARALRRRAATPPERGVAAAQHARPARAQPAGDRRSAAGGGGRRVRRRQRARRRREAQAWSRGSSSATRTSPRTRRSPTSTPRRCARAGYRVAVRSVGGLRRRAIAALRRGRIDLYPGYSGSLHEHLGGRSLRRALARIGAEPLRALPGAEPQRVRDQDATPRAGSAWRRSATSRPLEPRRAPRRPSRCRTSSGRSPRAACSTSRARGRSRRAPARSSRSSTPGPSSTTPTSRRTSGPTSARCPATAPTTTATATSTTSTAST